MPSTLAIASLLLLAAIMPGPNNIVMVRTGALGGIRTAVPAMTGVVLGGAVILILTTAGLGVLFVRWPSLRTFIAIGGASYLIWLGWCLVRSGGDTQGNARLPSGAVGLFGFQFLNPNSWAMMLTVTSRLPEGGIGATFIRLVPMFVSISTACLLLWVVMGRALMSRMACTSTRVWIDRAMGALLIASALLLFV